MKKFLFFSGCLLSFSLFGYQGKNPSPGFAFPIDGARKVVATVNSQTGEQFAIGYLAVTSVDGNGALDSANDQMRANQLLMQVAELYSQIYNQYSNSKPSYPPNGYKPNSGSTSPMKKPATCTPQTSCQHRRASKWRSQ